MAIEGHDLGDEIYLQLTDEDGQSTDYQPVYETIRSEKLVQLFPANLRQD